MIRKVAVFTGTRADYGLLYWLIKDIASDTGLALQLIVSGTHLSPEFGFTYQTIEKDGFKVDSKIEMLLSSDTAVGVAKSIGLATLGLADELSRLSPDVLVVLGDRFEALAAAQTAMILRIPILHIHGGEKTEGAYDDAIRHAITKLSLLHCTSTEIYRQRVIQMGEAPERVFNVGAIGLDHLKRSAFMTLDELSESLRFKLEKNIFLLTYHPVTLADEPPEASFIEILKSLDRFPEYKIVITYPNADDGGRSIIPLLEDYAIRLPERVLAIPSLGQNRYLSLLRYVDVVIGNSSSGIIEVPSFKKPTVNVGMRQKGRLAARSVIDAAVDSVSITKAIKRALKIKLVENNGPFVSPYGEGGVSKKIVSILKKPLPCGVKPFYDLNLQEDL